MSRTKIITIFLCCVIFSIIAYGEAKSQNSYDSAVHTGDVVVTKGSFVECAGFADDMFTVKGISVDRP